MSVKVGRSEASVARVLLTGAAGGIGTRLRGMLKGAYRELRLSDVRVPKGVGKDEKFVPADLADIAAVEKIVEGIDGIIHLGGISIEKPWEMIHPANIVGCYNLFEAARRHGVKRVVFASSNHVMGFYRRRRRVGTDALVRPDSRYGVSKAFGEALGALYADKYGLRVLCIRIGNFAEKPVDMRRMSIWISPDDLVQLIRIGLEHPALRYEVVYGASDNARSWWDNAAAFRLGYRPSGRAEEHLKDALAGQAKLPPDSVAEMFEGGPFCSDEFVGDPETRGS
ncbi:MAG TPA: NAD(P)-dependent oxidoreductase [Alphaproteobacteria bacterium]|jgi:uronate dehydrogenase